METEDETQLLPHRLPGLEWGRSRGRQLGRLSLSPAQQAPGLRGKRVTGRQGPAPKSEWQREGPRGTPPPQQHSCPGQAAAAAAEAAAARGPGAMHTFMTEKQLEWREAGETHDYLGRITGRGLGGPHGPNPEVTGGGPKRGSE